jgi:hypothetical protein
MTLYIDTDIEQIDYSFDLLSVSELLNPDERTTPKLNIITSTYNDLQGNAIAAWNFEIDDARYLKNIYFKLSGFEHENDDLDKFHRGSTEGYKQGTPASILQAGDKFDFDDYGSGGQAADLENEVVRFAKLVDLYKNGGPSEKDFAIPAYQRNKVPLYDLRTVPQDRWIELALYEE